MITIPKLIKKTSQNKLDKYLEEISFNGSNKWFWNICLPEIPWNQSLTMVTLTTILFCLYKPTSNRAHFSEMVQIRGEGVISGLSGSLIGVSLSSVHCFAILADHLNPQIEMEWICPLPILTVVSIVYICL